MVESDPFAVGPWCWLLANPRAIRPVAFKGQVALGAVDAVVLGLGAVDELHVQGVADDKLAAVLREQLSGIKVYRVGDEAEKQAFVVGKTGDGKWAGLKTTVVET